MKDPYKMLKINGKSMREHRYVMGNYLGRPLLPTEVIHHINGNLKDNRIQNLKLTNQSYHAKHYKRKPRIVKEILLICPICKKNFKRTMAYYKPRKAHNQKEFYCSIHCARLGVISNFHNTERFMYKNHIDKLIKIELKKGLSGYKIAKKYNLNSATVYNHINSKFNFRHL